MERWNHAKTRSEPYKYGRIEKKKRKPAGVSAYGLIVKKVFEEAKGKGKKSSELMKIAAEMWDKSKKGNPAPE